MSVRTRADEALDEAREQIQAATKSLSYIVADRCWGTDELTRNRRADCAAAMNLLAQVQGRLEMRP